MIGISEQLQGLGFSVEELARPDAMRWWRTWCQTFLNAIKASEGRYLHRGLHWHGTHSAMVWSSRFQGTRHDVSIRGEHQTRSW